MDVNNAGSIGADIGSIVLIGVTLQATKLYIRKNLYPSLAMKVFKLTDEKNVYNFSKQLWGLTWHTFIFIFELAVVFSDGFAASVFNPYGSDLDNLWTSAPISIGIRSIYLIQIGYYSSDIFTLILVDKPNDLVMMCVHHFAALILLWISYIPTFGEPAYVYRLGMAILVLHEIGDVTLYAAKTLHYAQFETISEGIFVVNVLVWIWSRLILFPRVIAANFDADPMSRWQTVPAAILLLTLCVMHVYWCYLMLKVLYKALFKGEQMQDKRDRGIDEGGVEITERAVGELVPTGVTASSFSSPPAMLRQSSLVGSFIMTKNPEELDYKNMTLT